jgi:hypothetical protein
MEDFNAKFQQLQAETNRKIAHVHDTLVGTIIEQVN